MTLLLASSLSRCPINRHRADVPAHADQNRIAQTQEETDMETKELNVKSESGKKTSVPRHFQCPNEWVDQYCALLTGEEYKALIFATRQILGRDQDKRSSWQARISLSQFMN